MFGTSNACEPGTYSIELLALDTVAGQETGYQSYNVTVKPRPKLNVVKQVSRETGAGQCFEPSSGKAMLTNASYLLCPELLDVNRTTVSASSQ